MMRTALLSRGFLPRELPPPFSSNSLGHTYGTGQIPNQIRSRNFGLSSPVSHNLPRAGLLRRPLSIPDPIHYIKLTKNIESGWRTLRRLQTGANLTLSRPIRDHSGHRAFTFRIGFSRQSGFRARNRSGARYLLSADINQFYQSLYTHAIPWAIHGKTFAKNHRQLRYLGNMLDKCVRDSQQGQTMGIPIGPDTSFILAETLLSSFDLDIIQMIGTPNGIRSLDDYEFAFSTYTEAENGVAVLQEKLSEFELTLNPRKTVISDCPVPLNPPWHSALQSIPLPDSGSITRRVLIAFLDRAFDTVHSFPNEPIINWMISRLMSFDFSANHWRIVEPMVLQATTSEPGSLPRCLRLMLMAQQAGRTIDQQRLLYALGVTIQNAVRRGHGSEAAWAVWGHILFNLNLDSATVSLLDTMNEDIVALVTLDAKNRGLINSSTSFPNWESHLTSDGLRDGHWLLVYESIKKGWLTPPILNPVTTNSAYNHLLRNDVNFYIEDDPVYLTNQHKHTAPSWMTPPRSYLL